MSQGVRGPFPAEILAIATKHDIKEGEINLYKCSFFVYILEVHVQ
jgi:hypothetical protein